MDLYLVTGKRAKLGDFYEVFPVPDGLENQDWVGLHQLGARLLARRVGNSNKTCVFYPLRDQ